MNWYKKASPISENGTKIDNYLHIGHDRTYYKDDVDHNTQEIIWIIDNNLDIYAKAIEDSVKAGYKHADFAQEMSIDESDILFAGRCSIGPSRSLCSIRDGQDAFYMKDFNARKYNYLKNRAVSILDRKFNNPEIRVF